MSGGAAGPGAAFRRAAEVLVLLLGALAALMAQLAPLGPLPDAPMPDLFWCVLSFFALRRPEATPMLLVFALTLTRDALLGGPLGAGALSLLLGTEVLRLRARATPAPRSLLGDWAAAALVYAAAVGLQWLMMALTFAQPPSPMALAPHVATTALAIPFVAGFLRYVLRLGASPRESEA
ncbi:MAG: hypothetical protein CML46_15820 [Rhodobacteraceae bacterium]|nr:hypothetical protein [Paracoccaceae bacterium]MBR28390.1 hypothetical protein [Paracoccaceae bacterium]